MFLATVVLARTTHANQPAYIVAQNVIVDGKILQLDLPVEGVRFKVFWVGEDNRQWQKDHFARKGIYPYEMRDHPEWQGARKIVAITNFQGSSGVLKKPSFKDEIEMFLAPEQWVPATINYLSGHTLLGRGWEAVLTLGMMVFSLLIYFYKKSIAISLFFGFTIVWVLMDARTMYDHFAIVEGIKDNLGIHQRESIKSKLRIASSKIGDGSWSHVGLKWPLRSVIPYELAEKKYLPFKSASKADFIITKEKGQLVLKSGKE